MSDNARAMINQLNVNSALAKPLATHNDGRRGACCHLTIRNFSTHPLKSGLRLSSPNAQLLDYETRDASATGGAGGGCVGREAERNIMPASHVELIVQQNGWRSTTAKFKIFFSYHVMESAADMSRKSATWFCHFLLPVSVVYDRMVSYYCGFAKSHPDLDIQNESRPNADAIFDYWKDQMLQLSRFALQAQDQTRFLECYAGDSKFAEIKIDFICRCPQCLAKSSMPRRDSTMLAHPLHEALLDANAFKMAKLLHDKAESPDSVDFRNRSPLHLAAKENFFDIAKLLIQHGANKNGKDISAVTPLIEAAFWGSFDVVKLLVNEFPTQVCDLRAAAQDGRTALHEAAGQNHSQIVRFFLEKDRTLVNTADSKGYTPLHLACECGSFESAKLLLDHYADPKLLTSFGATPLHLAARGAHTDVVDLLMHKCRAQSFLVVEDSYGFTPVRYGVYTDSIPFLTALANYGGELRYVSKLDKRMGVHDAAEMGSTEMLRYFVKERKVRADMADLFGDTPMHVASFFGNVNIVRDLVVEYRANTSNLNAAGATAFFLASAQGRLAVVKYFLEVDTYLMRIPIADDGRLPIHYAIYNGHEDVVEAMIEYGADVLSSNDARRKTVFDFAVQAGRSKIAEMLITALKKN